MRIIDRFLNVIEAWIFGKTVPHKFASTEAFLEAFVDRNAISRHCCPVCGRCFESAKALKQHLLSSKSSCRRNLIAMLHTVAEAYEQFVGSVKRCQYNKMYGYKIVDDGNEIKSLTLDLLARHFATKFVRRRG